MKFLKNNLKLIIGILIGAILAGGIVYAATVSAKDVTYTTNKNGQVQTVEDALNYLYSNFSSTNSLKERVSLMLSIKGIETSKDDDNDTIIDNLSKLSNMEESKSNQIPEGITNVKIVVVRITTYSQKEVSITGDIINNLSKKTLTSDTKSGSYAVKVEQYDVITNGNAGTINVNISDGSSISSCYYYIYY